MSACPQNLALGQLLIRLRPLQRALRVAVALRAAAARKLREAGAVAEVVTVEHANALLDELDDLIEHRSISAGRASLAEAEAAMQERLREEAAGARARLPLDALAAELRLDDFEQEVLVLCASLELDLEFERVLGYVHDDVSRRGVSVEIACALTAGSLRERVQRRFALGPFGRLRRLGLLATTARESGLRDELRLTPACVDALLGAPVDLAATFRDPAEVSLEPPAVVPADEQLLAGAADALAARRVGVLALWGRPRAIREAVSAVALRAGLRVRRYPIPGVDAVAAAAAAAALQSLLWVDLDAFGERIPDDLAEAWRKTSVPVVVSGSHAWRPPELIAERGWLEIGVTELDQSARRLLWSASLPGVEEPELDRIAGSFRFDATEVRAAARLARATAVVRTNGHAVSASDCLREACSAVARKHGERHTALVIPRRCPDDLVLPPELHARVLDIALYMRALPRVMEDWGFARRVSGGGVKALFTGDSGTGKTLAAEVVAYELGLSLLKVDLARVVSKWIGETEKNLDVAFEEARDSHAVLFFDEAEALFGARGEVRHGTDRYANLEVSYLLQRLEDHDGLVILASNLRDKIDPAFMRRFHVVVGFPRPTEKERKRMWQRLFSAELPVAGDLDLPALARLDLTGAGIVGAVQTAAFLAAGDNGAVSMRHVVQGVVRQFQREARVLTAHDLGAHAAHMGSS